MRSLPLQALTHAGLGLRRFDNISVLGPSRMDNPLKAHI